MYAVISLQWHQYIVEKDMLLEVDNIKNKKESDKFDVNDVLCVFNDDGSKFSLWKPFVEWARVVCEHKNKKKWKKIRITKFKRKNRYTKIIWFRPHKSVLYIKDIIINE